MKGLYEREVLAEMGGQPQPVIDEHTKLALSMAAEVRTECLRACPGRMTQEEVACYLRAERLEALKGCQ
jgi:hypothetical protein